MPDSMTGAVSEGDVLQALRQVQDPDLHRDLVTLGMIEDVVIQGGAVSFTVVLTTPACPVKKVLQERSRAVVAALPGVSDVAVKMTARVIASGAMKPQGLLPGVKNTIAVGSGKGGVGKSTLSVGLALGLASSGAKVGLLDADIYGPNVPIMLGLDQAGAQPTQMGNHIMPINAYGMKTMSVGYLLPSGEPLVWRGPMVGKMVTQFLSDVEWGELDYLVVDLPPGTGDASLSLAQAIPLSGAVIVSTPQDVALQDTTKALQMFQKLEVPILGMVENMSYFLCPHCNEQTDIFGHGGAEAAASRLGVNFLGSVPLNMSIRVGGDEGRPVVVALPDAPEGRIFLEIAERTAARLSVLARAAQPVIQIRMPGAGVKR